MRHTTNLPTFGAGLPVRIGLLVALCLLFLVPAFSPVAIAQEAPVRIPAGQAIEQLQGEVTTVQVNLNTVWTVVAGILVFFMQGGFMLLELGFSRAKNTINVIMKNFLDCCVSSLTFFFFGFGLMFGANAAGDAFGLVGTDHFGIPGLGVNSLNLYDASSWNWTFWFFQVVFASTACTIVSGAMAERTKFRAYLVYTFFIAAFIYPVVGHWVWSGGVTEGSTGWLAALNFRDFAGSTVVHATGGACALAGIIVVGPRVGRFAADGTPRLIVGHNIPMAALGTFILWFCWFGFNAGSTTVGDGTIGRIAVNTHLAACAGAVIAMLAMWLSQGKSDIGIALNGSLAGLVAITAGCADATPLLAIVIGAVGGLCATFGAILLEALKLDDVVGAVPVHLFAGVWGTIAVGFWPLAAGMGMDWELLRTQTIGTFTCVGFTFVCAFTVFSIIKLTIGLRVSDVEQREGLDFHEHAATAYPDFATTEQNL